MTRGDLSWTIEVREGLRVVTPAGRVDEASATAFAERLAQEIDSAASDGATRLAIDLAAIDYMSSRGLRGLTLAQRQSSESGITIILVQPNEIMREILAISRYDKVFQVFDSMERIDAA